MIFYENYLSSFSGYCDRYYFGESWRDWKTDEEVTTKDAKC